MLDQFIGQTLANKYRIDSFSRASDLGKVYRATHVSMDKPVTVKILAPALAVDETIVNQFSAEARAVSHIAHPNVLNVTDFGSDRECGYIVTKGGSATLKTPCAGKVDFRRHAPCIYAPIASALSPRTPAESPCI